MDSAEEKLLSDAYVKRHEEQMLKEAEVLLKIQEDAKTFDKAKFDYTYGDAWPRSAELTQELAEALRSEGIDVRHLYSPATVVVHGGEQKIAYTVKSCEVDGVSDAVSSIDKIMALNDHEVVFLLGLFEQKIVDARTFAPSTKYKLRFFTTVSLDEKPVKEYRF